MKVPKPLLIDLPFSEWKLEGLPSYRIAQVRDWIFAKGILDFEDMSNLPLSLRTKLKDEYHLTPMDLAKEQGSFDTTQKFLWKLRDGQLIESVLIRATEGTQGVRATRLTLCVSTQVGCGLGCKFCASGLDGLKRNLSTGEILGQIILARTKAGKRIDNLVFMGMGEPLANLSALIPALDQILSPQGLGIGARHITLSTSGLVPKILELAKYPAQIRLAISLHGGDDETRRKIMPINDRYSIDELFAACQTFIKQRKKMITLEYILIEGINDDLKQAELLAKHAIKLNAKVNLIPYNRVDGLDWKRPSLTQIEAFHKRVSQLKAPRVTLRMEKGHDIEAACGQLRLRENKASSQGGENY